MVVVVVVVVVVVDFFLACEDLGRKFDHSFPASAFFSFLFLLSGNYLAHTNSTLYARISPQWLGELRRLWPNVSWVVVCELVSGPALALCLDSGIVSLHRLPWVKIVCVFRCNLPPALLAEWPGSFTCHCGNTGVGTETE